MNDIPIQKGDRNEGTNHQVDSHLPTDWPVKDSQIAEIAALHGVTESEYGKVKATPPKKKKKKRPTYDLPDEYVKLKAKLKEEHVKEVKHPHDVKNYGVVNDGHNHPLHSYDATKTPAKDSYSPPPYGTPGKEQSSPSYGIPEEDTYGEPPHHEVPNAPVIESSSFGEPKDSYTHPKEEPPYKIPPPPEGNYALPKPPIGQIIDSYGLPKVQQPPSYHDDVPSYHEDVPVYSPTGPPMPQMYYDAVTDYNHPEVKEPVHFVPKHREIEQPVRLTTRPVKKPFKDYDGPEIGFAPTAPDFSFDETIEENVNAEEDKFSFDGFSDSFPFGQKEAAFKPRDFKRPPSKERHHRKRPKSKKPYSGKAKFPPAPTFETPAFKDFEKPTSYSVFKQSFKEDHDVPDFRSAVEFDDYDAAEGREASLQRPPKPPPPPPQPSLPSRFPTRNNVPLIKAPQPPPPPPPPGPPPPPPPPYQKANKHGAVEIAEIGE